MNQNQAYFSMEVLYKIRDALQDETDMIQADGEIKGTRRCRWRLCTFCPPSFLLDEDGLTGKETKGFESL